MITPHSLAPDAGLTIGVMIASAVALLLISFFYSNTKKWQGALMFGGYVVFVMLLILQNYGVISLVA